MSHASSSSSSFVRRCPASGSPRASRARATYAAAQRCRARAASCRPPETSETATTVAPMRLQLGRRDAADVAEALHDAALPGERPAEPVAGARDAPSRRRAPVASWRKTEPPIDDRLPGDDLRHRVAALHRVRVHHPRHRLLVRRHVRRGDVLLRADDRQQLRGEAAREPLELAARTGRAARSARRPSRRRTAGAGARTSTSSTSRARRTRRASPRGRSGCRPSSGRCMLECWTR